jgi:RHS repeat-associated protein
MKPSLTAQPPSTSTAAQPASLQLPSPQGEKVSYYLSDHLGSSSVITDSSGKVTREYEYKPYGEIFTERIYDSSSETPNFFYTGKRLDKETGLYYYGARYYDPALGKFITPDTIVQAPFDPQSLNRYSYCRNNPINLIDPTGHSWKEWKGKVIGAIVGIVVLVVTYNPQLAMMAYSFVSTAIDAHTAGYSTGRAIGMAAASAAASYIGGRIGASFGEALGGGAGTSGGMFWGSVFGGMGSGAAGGAAGAAVAGGDVGKAAYQGAAIGAGMGAVVGIFRVNAAANKQAQAKNYENTKLSLDVSKSDDASRSAFRGRQPAENDVAGSMAGEMQAASNSPTGSLDFTFNAGTGVFGASGRLSITGSGIKGYVGAGWGIGFGVSATTGATFGNSSGWGIAGSLSGGSIFGWETTYTMSRGGTAISGGLGFGVGVGGSATIGYEGDIISW